MALLLYDNPASGNALKVRFLLHELGLEWATREVPLARPRPGWYLDLNPLGGVPTLDDAGFVLTESNTILRYLAHREGQTDLYPDEPAERAAVDEFLDRWSLTFRPALKRLEAASTTEADGDAIATLVADTSPTLMALERFLPPSGFALGRFTLADIAAAPALLRSTTGVLDLAVFPAIGHWRETVLDRPAFARAR